jgi:UDP-N-acetylglucosamine 1-carboxyvinyltransferase
MKILKVRGGYPLNGHVRVSGSKNAALPIIFSCILINGVSEIENLPDIGDTRIAFQILRDMGAVIQKNGDTTYIDTRDLRYIKPKNELVDKIRASTYLIGACLGRFGICHMGSFGGCNFSHRPIDMHIGACLSLGCEIRGDSIIGFPCEGEIHFNKPSVGATVNAILLTSSVDGRSVIHGAAREPHIDCLIEFLISAGAGISRTKDRIEVVGSKLSGGKIRVIDDMIEAGSYMALSYLTDGKIELQNIPHSEMTAVTNAFCRMGLDCDERYYTHITAEPYPGFPTDLQPIFAPLMAKYRGGVIIDNVWPERFGYLKSLEAFGIKSVVKGNHAEIYPSSFHSATVNAPDLRGGFACLMTALMAEGESRIYSAEIILRGYENLVGKLSCLSADISIESI